MVLILWILRVIWFLSCVPLPIWRRAINLRLLQHSFSCHLWCWNLLLPKCLLFHIWRCLKRVYMLLIKLDRCCGIWRGFPASALSRSCRLFFLFKSVSFVDSFARDDSHALGTKRQQKFIICLFSIFYKPFASLTPVRRLLMTPIQLLTTQVVNG